MRGVEMINTVHKLSLGTPSGIVEIVRRKRKFAKLVQRFGRDEEGAMVALSLFVFLIILIMGGVGIDMMRQEMERAHLTAVLDNAVLTGAAAPSNIKPEEIVADYFEKSKMSK